MKTIAASVNNKTLMINFKLNLTLYLETEMFVWAASRLLCFEYSIYLLPKHFEMLILSLNIFLQEGYRLTHVSSDKLCDT